MPGAAWTVLIVVVVGIVISAAIGFESKVTVSPAQIADAEASRIYADLFNSQAKLKADLSEYREYSVEWQGEDLVFARDGIEVYRLAGRADEDRSLRGPRPARRRRDRRLAGRLPGPGGEEALAGLQAHRGPSLPVQGIRKPAATPRPSRWARGSR